MLVAGVTVEYSDEDGRVRGGQVRVLDFDEPEGNDWLAANQFTVVVENRHERRPDIVLFVNGLPLAVVELKNPADENAKIHTAFQQLQTYKAEIPSLFAFNAPLIVSDGMEARIGTLTAGWEWFKRWRATSGEALAEPALPQLRVLLEGSCDPHRLLALVRDFIVCEDVGSGALVKKMAGYHQFHAVQSTDFRFSDLVRSRPRRGEAHAARRTGRRSAAPHRLPAGRDRLGRRRRLSTGSTTSPSWPATRASFARDHGGDGDTPEARLRLLDAFLEHCRAMRTPERTDDDDVRVTLSTLHGAKRLEFHTVVIVGFDTEHLAAPSPPRATATRPSRRNAASPASA